jgi:hypothetical protein
LVSLPASSSMRFDVLQHTEVEPSILNAYSRGLLVPFIGAGMSRETCVTWPGLVSNLVLRAGIEESAPVENPEVLIRLADKAARTLRRRGELLEALADSLYEDPARSATPQAKSLAKTYWPLVLSTNYDDLFASAYRDRATQSQRERPASALEVVGRSPSDCQRVLTSLNTLDVPLLWALQGYLGGDGGSSLGSELVVGHQEYRRVTHREPHFRRAFADVFRRRSFLFLGSGLAEPYFLDLFGEVLEFYGPNPHPHYALMLADSAQTAKIDPGFLQSRYNIRLQLYADHADLIKWLDVLSEQVLHPPAAASSWGFRYTGALTTTEGYDDIRIVASPLPQTIPPDEAILVSAGRTSGSNDFGVYLSGVREALEKNRFRGVEDSSKWTDLSGKLLWQGPDHPDETQPRLFAAMPWATLHQRDFRLVYEASLLAFKHIAGRYKRLRMTLLGSGASSHFGSEFSLIEILRAYGAFRRTSRDTLTVTVHVVDQPVVRALRAGTIDPLPLVSQEEISIWAQVEDTERPERELIQKLPGAAIRELAASLGVPDNWSFSVAPEPVVGLGTRRLEKHQDMSLQDAGVVAGGTVIFRRDPPGRTDVVHDEYSWPKASQRARPVR